MHFSIECSWNCRDHLKNIIFEKDTYKIIMTLSTLGNKLGWDCKVASIDGERALWYNNLKYGLMEVIKAWLWYHIRKYETWL